MLIFWTIIFLLLKTAASYVEMVEEVGFDNTTMRLTCRHFDSVIVIHNAAFQPSDEDSTFEPQRNVNDMREALNHRCSGVNHCSFILNVDCPGAHQWGSGNFTIKYACISDSERIKYCNKDIALPSEDNPGLSEAYVHNPGYPKFYLGQQSCSWRITAPNYQKIKVTILDLSLVGNFEKCHDQLVIKDSGQPIYSSCTNEEPLVDVISASDTLEVILTSRETLIPRRGLLFHFSAVGCPLPKTPPNGYLVIKNDTTAIFGCCADYTFSDSNQRTKVLKCQGYKWDLPLPLASCDNRRVITDYQEYFAIRVPQQSNMQELIAPIVLIVLLFGINAVVLFIIFQYRKRKNASAVCNEEELKTFSVTSGGVQMA